jgi:hypothetical protein
VIEYFSARYEMPAAGCQMTHVRVATTLDTQVAELSHYFTPTRTLSAPDRTTFVVGESTRLYAGPGTTVFAGSPAFGDGCNPFSVIQQAVSGYLVSLP